MSHLYPKKGFTLIELLIVISIIAILSTIGIAIYGQITTNARDARRKLDLQNIAQALEVYYQKNGRYPITGWVYSTSANWIVDSPPVDTSAVAFDSTYMSSIPQDPRENIGDLQTLNTAGFGYSFCSDKVSCYNTCSAGNGQWYMLMAQLENHNDPDTRAGGKIYKTCNGTIFTSWSQYLYIITPK